MVVALVLLFLTKPLQYMPNAVLSAAVFLIGVKLVAVKGMRGYRREVMWWSIEVFDGAFPATLWQDAHGSFLVEAALTRRGRNWWWHRHNWGVVFEVEFDDEDTWETFRRLPAVQAALDAVPDPIEGLLIYPGRGGSSGRVAPRRTSPTTGSGAATLPIPPDEILPEPAPDPRSTAADLAPL